MADGIVTLKERLSAGVPARVACRAAPSPSWDDVAEDLRWAETHFRHAATLVDGDRLIDMDGLSDETCRMALMHILQSGYNAVEAAMLRIMLVLDEEPPSGEE